jgi:quinoprotein glucose dehydrogenase
VSRTFYTSLLRIAPVAGLFAWVTLPALGQNAPANTDWRSYGGDLANHRYAPLDQINGGNFKNLEIAWRFKTENLGPRKEFQFESTPLIVKGVMYSTAGTRRAVVAIDAGTGEMLWMHSENEGPRGQNAPRLLSGRGLAFWTDGREERILYVTPGYRLVALDARTGNRIAGFGTDGIVDLKLDNDQDIDLVTGEVGLHATPMIGNDVVVIGAAHRPGGVPRGKANVKGFIRGFDVRTGKRLWIFHTIPNLGEFGNETWEKDSWKYTGNTGAWGQVAIDEELNLAYLPIELATGDYYGGPRPGANCQRNEIAVDPRRVRKWHYHPCTTASGLRHGRGPHPGRHHSQRPGDQSHRAADQTGVALRIRSQQRSTGVADRGAAGAERRCAGRVVLAHAAFRDQASGVRSPGGIGRRLDRFHSGAPC